MKHLEHPEPNPARQQLEQLWRLRSEVARQRYETAAAHYRKLLKERPEGPTPRPDDPLLLARHEEAQALAAYIHTLKLFTALTVDGQIPEQEIALGANGERR